MKIEIDRSSFALGALAAVSIALLCSQTLITPRPQSTSVDRVMTLIVPAPRQAASVTDPDSSGSKGQQDANPQPDRGVCQGKAPDCWNDQSQSSSSSDGDDDDDSFDPPDPADPVPA